MTGRSTGWVRPQPIRDAILAYLTEPRLARDIALHIDRPVPTATGHLAAMRRRGLVKRIAYAVYAPPDWPAPAETMGQSAKSQPTRTAILAYLTEPRSVRQITLHIDRSSDTTRSHLTDMRRRGLIKRVGRGVYARSDSPMPEYPSGSLVRPGTSRAAILAYLAEPRTVREIALHIDRSGPTTKDHLAVMNRRGLVKRVGYGVYALPDLSAEAQLTTPSHAVTLPASCQHFAPLPARHRNLEDLSLGTGQSEAAVKAALNDSWLHDDSRSAPVEPTRRLFLARRILSHAVRRASG